MPSTKRLSDAGGAKPTKRPRSSRSRTKNTAWDFAPQHRSAGVKQDASTLHRGGAFGSLIVSCGDEDADVDEAAAALLAMSCPQPLPKEEANWSPPASPRKHNFARKRAGSVPMPPDSSFQFAAVPMEVQGTGLPVYPRLIISSKSNASDESSATNLELKTAAGGSTESIQSTGELIQRSKLAEALASSVDNLSGKQSIPVCDLYPRPQAMQHSHPYFSAGPTISSGSPQARAGIREKQAAAGARSSFGGARVEGPFPYRVLPKAFGPANPGHSAPNDAPPVHYTLKPSPSSSHAGLYQPAVRSRGGRLIVLPDTPPSSHVEHASAAAQPQRTARNVPVHLPWQAPLVLAKASQPRLQTSANALQSARNCDPNSAEPKQVLLSQARLVTVKSEPGLATAFRLEKGKWGPEEARAQEGSGEGSSEEAWQPDWGLSLFSALNPHVITTGLNIANQGRSTSQPLDAN